MIVYMKEGVVDKQKNLQNIKCKKLIKTLNAGNYKQTDTFSLIFPAINATVS